MQSELITQQTKFWRLRNLGELELIHAHYRNHRFPRHLHEEYIIGIIVQGVEELVQRGRVYTAPAGSLVLINPGEPHSNYSINEAGFTYRVFYPSAALLRQISLDVTGREDAPVFTSPVIQKSELFDTLLKLHVSLVRSDSAFEQESEFISVMTRLVAEHSATKVPSLPPASGQRYVKKAREYIDAYYTDDLTLRHLAKVCGVSPFHLARTFRNEIGLPPFEYQNQMRISQAKKLLRRGWSIADTAAETGFVDQSHLTKTFKRIVGVTPGVFIRPQLDTRLPASTKRKVIS